MPKRFIKRVEDFACEKCGFEVKGNGYTDHCPKCLWSKHVDNNPGDREATCGGMMEPVDVIHEAGEDRVINRCIKCSHIKKNRMAVGDNYDVVFAIVKNKAEKLAGEKHI